MKASLCESIFVHGTTRLKQLFVFSLLCVLRLELAELDQVRCSSRKEDAVFRLRWSSVNSVQWELIVDFLGLGAEQPMWIALALEAH